MKIQRITLIAGILLVFSLPVNGQVDGNFNKNVKTAFSASSEIECRTSLKFCMETLTVIPNHPVINYLTARLNEQLGHRDIAIEYLKKAATLGYTSNARWLKANPITDPAFSDLRTKDKFNEIVKIMDNSDKPVQNSQVAFTINNEKLDYYEGITYDPDEKFFYLGSNNEIFKVDHLGNSTVFIRDGIQNGLGSVNGIHVDSIRRTLWACSNDDNRENVDIFKYDLSSGKLIKKYSAPSDGDVHMFNDLVIHPNGDVYVTDTYEGGIDGAIYKIPITSDKLELFFKAKSFFGPNGITLSEDGKLIFVATDYLGICKIDIENKSMIRLEHKNDFHTYGIDGLYFADNYLYAVQNMLLTQVSRFSMNKNATYLENCEVFEKNTPDLRAPSTGVIVDDYFYFIAGSNKNGVVIMKTSIK